MRKYIWACLVVALVATGCAKKNAAPVTADANACEEAYTYAPATYVIPIVMGDAVILDPVANNFPLFCTPEATRQRVDELKERGVLSPQSEWKVYRVYGNWADITTEVEPGVFYLNRPVPLVDWVEEE